MTPTQQDSPTEGPPSKHTGSTIHHTSTSTPQPLSQNYPRANACQTLLITSQHSPTPPYLTDTGQIGNTCSPPTCPNTPHSLGTQMNNRKNKKNLLHTATELNSPAIDPLSLVCQGSEVWDYKKTSVQMLAKATLDLKA
eukprot:1159799-Pelagomonas_calceolata.AAC.4